MLYFTLIIVAFVPAPFSHLSTTVHTELVVASTEAVCLEFAKTRIPACRAQHGYHFTYVPHCVPLTKA